MIARHVALPLLACAMLTACDADPKPSGLAARDWLVRASLDMRGTRPTLDELDAIQADPSRVDAMVASFVDDPRVEQRVRSIFAAAFRTRRDQYYWSGEDLGLDEEQEASFQRALAEEVPSLIAHVALSDAPFTDILLVDYTVVDPILLALWPLAPMEQAAEHDAQLPAGTVKARYVDGRPAAGVLATNAIHWRHTSTVENANRGRSNALSRALLCEDYLDRPIDFPKDVDLTDSESIHHAIQTNPGCRACHGTLDPFASHLWGFMQTEDDDVWAWTRYQPQNELLWQEQTDAAPAYFGEPTDGALASLALAIASDERFVSCTVRRVYEDLLGRPAVVADEGQLAAHREAFLSSGLSLKALMASVLSDPAYRGMDVDSEYGGRPAAALRKLASPELLTSTLADLSAYTLSVDGRAATDVDYALRALGGGSERGPGHDPALGHPLVQRRLAEAAARAIVDGLSPASRVGRWLATEDLSLPPSDAIAAIVFREIGSREPTPGERARLASLWQAVVDDTGDTADAWTAWLTALFADPELSLY